MAATVSASRAHLRAHVRVHSLRAFMTHDCALHCLRRMERASISTANCAKRWRLPVRVLCFSPWIECTDLHDWCLMSVLCAAWRMWGLLHVCMLHVLCSTPVVLVFFEGPEA